MEKRKVPALRFKDFTQDWEQRKLGECFSERIETMPDGELISVTINDGVKKFSELGRFDNSNPDKSKYKKVCSDDIAYNSMRMWQGASGYSPYTGIVSPAYTVLIPNECVNSKFVSYLFKRDDILNVFQINSQGITSDNWNLKYPVLSKIKIKIPGEIKEQKFIACCFMEIDNLITLHQRKLEKLKKIKKSMLEKMFPKNNEKIPEIRFSAFFNDWEQRKLGELVSFAKGHGYSKSSLVDEGAPIVLYGRLYTDYETIIKKLDTRAIPLDNSVYSIGGEVVVPASGETADDIAIASVVENAGVLLGGDLNILYPSNNINPTFLAINITSGKPHCDIAQKAQGKSVVHVHNDDLAKVNLHYPNIKEQEKISNFQLMITTLITLHQRKLEKLKKIKKSMLEKMFI